MGKIFCVEFQSYPLKFHTKYITHTLKVCFLYNIKILGAYRLKSSSTFLKYISIALIHTVALAELMVWFDLFMIIYLAWDKMDDILQMTYSNAFSLMKMFELCLIFDWCLFIRVQLAIIGYCEEIENVWSIFVKKNLIMKADKVHTDYRHDVVIKWEHFLRYGPFVLGIHWSPVNSPYKGLWCGT